MLVLGRAQDYSRNFLIGQHREGRLAEVGGRGATPLLNVIGGCGHGEYRWR